MKTSWRLRFFNNLLCRFMTSKIDVVGREELGQLSNVPVVVATSHLTDIDIPLVVNTLGPYLPIKVTDQTVHHHWAGEPNMLLSLLVAGKGNFLPMQVTRVGGKKYGFFKPADFVPMVHEMRSGFSLVVAAENPSYDGSTATPGIGAVYLASLAGTPILPVAVRIHALPGTAGMDNTKWKTIVRKPQATIVIGDSYRLPEIFGIAQMEEAIRSKQRGTFHALAAGLKDRSRNLQRRLRSLTGEL